MVIVRIFGGFASQLQKYSLGLNIADVKKTELCLDLSDYMNGYFRPFVLNAFCLPECHVLTDRKKLIRKKVISNGRQLLEAFDNWNDEDIYISGEESQFSEFFEKYPNMKLSNESKVYSYMKLKSESDFVTDFKNEIEGIYSIGVHVRLGDFVAVGAADSIDYYKASIGYALSIHPNASVYFFSNDIDEVRKKFGNDSRFSFISRKNGYLGDLEEFICLSHCDLKIISSRSGYSRYAAQLGIGQYNCEKAITNEIVYGMENSAITLDEMQYNAGLNNYEYVKNDDEIKKENEELEYRYDTMLSNSELVNLVERHKYWKEYYGYSGEVHNIVYITSENFNRWYNKGQYLKAIVSARIGHNVLYINTRCKESYGLIKDEIIDSKDYDGRDLGFKLFLIQNSNIEISSIVDSWIENGDKCDVIHDKASAKILTVFDRLLGIMLGDACRIISKNVKCLPDKLSMLSNVSDVSQIAEKGNL